MKKCRVIDRTVPVVFALLAVLILGPALPPAHAQAPPPGPAPPDPGANANIDVQMRGPVHEAFAQPDVFDPTPSEVVAQQPPDPVTEMPPSEKPEGTDVAWIPGYWSWEPDLQRFIWVSGIWRTLPSGLEWVPGYWTQTGNGFQWVSGFWRRADVTQVAYLPQPPESLEEGPVGEPPSQDYVWVPGVWIYNTQYAWRPGFWAQCQPGWIWTPAYYVWTPSGYIYVDGYWDYEVVRRGVLFAPVYFKNRFAFAAGYAFTPSIIWDCNLLTDYLFCRPRWCCYCFGDYYAANWVKAGIYPWFSFHGSRFGYDPIYAYYSWSHRNDRNWHHQLVVDYRDRRDHVNLRPPLTYAALRSREGRPGFRPFAMPLNTFVTRHGDAMRFEKITNVRRDEILRNDREMRAFRDKRLELERNRPITRKPGEHEEVRRITIPKTPRGPELKPERGRVETGHVDRGRVETGRVDRGRVETGRVETGRVETGRVETGRVETGRAEHFEHKPPVGPRRPEVTNRPIPKEHVVRPHPAENLANPKFEPRPANKGRPRPEPQRKPEPKRK